jgi:hypothetical protein
LVGKGVGRFAQYETEVIEMHTRLAAALRAMEAGTTGDTAASLTPHPTVYHHDAPLHRMLDRANNYLTRLAPTQTENTGFEDWEIVDRDLQAASHNSPPLSGTHCEVPQLESSVATVEVNVVLYPPRNRNISLQMLLLSLTHPLHLSSYKQKGQE